MKLKALLLALVAISLAACSGDDSNPIETTQGEVIQMIGEFYDENGIKTGETIYDIEDKKTVKVTFYSQGELERYDDYEYNDEGMLEFVKSYLDGELWNTNEFEYDSQGRVIAQTHTFANSEQTSIRYYTHNNDNTITVSGGETATYFINEQGRVYKHFESEFSFTEAEYEGNNIIRLSTYSTSADIIYDEEHEPKGDYHQIDKEQFGNYLANGIVCGGFGYGLGVDKYLLAVDGSGNTGYSQVYEFDDEGYPVKMSRYYEGSPQPSSELTIIYQ